MTDRPIALYRLVVLHRGGGETIAFPVYRLLSVLPLPEGSEHRSIVNLSPEEGCGMHRQGVTETPERVAAIVSAVLNGWHP